MIKWWGRLLEGNIIGIVDSHGAVHSEFTGGEMKTHEIFGGNNRNAHCRWRWNNRESIHWFTVEMKPTEEQYDLIQAHLTKKYGLLWWDNGHHDLDHLHAKVSEEQADHDYKPNPVLSDVKITTPLIRVVLTGNRVDDVNRVIRDRLACVYQQTHGSGVDTTVYIHAVKLRKKAEREAALAAYRQRLERVADVESCEYLPFWALLPAPLAMSDNG